MLVGWRSIKLNPFRPDLAEAHTRRYMALPEDKEYTSDENSPKWSVNMDINSQKNSALSFNGVNRGGLMPAAFRREAGSILDKSPVTRLIDSHSLTLNEDSHQFRHGSKHKTSFTHHHRVDHLVS